MTRGAFVLVAAAQFAAQQLPDADPRLLRLAMLRARAELALADSAYARTRHLFEQRLVSPAELEARAVERERATLSVLERWTALTSAAPWLRVLSARKARRPDGAVLVRVRVATAVRWPGGGDDWDLPGDVRERLHAGTGGDAYLSIKDEPGAPGTAIGAPYERRVALETERVRELEFRLLRDVDAVVVSLSAAGRVDERKVWLETDVSGSITIEPAPFSQEADLGTEATYDLMIERFGGGSAPIRLTVEGLPPAVAYGFIDAESGARIGQLRFAPGEYQRRVRLALALPAGETGTMVVDSAYRFRVLAAPAASPDESAGSAVDVPRARTSETDSPGGAGGVTELELVARGIGRAEIRAFNLFHEVVDGTPLEIAVVLRNAGSRPIERLGVQADLPTGWVLAATPSEWRDVEPGAERPVRLTITPAADAELGDYEGRLRVDGSSGQARLAGEPTVLRLRLQSRRSRAAVAALLAVLLLTATIAVATARRIARR